MSVSCTGTPLLYYSFKV
uniref:Uncharacterized protein n=1 Tax=Rhizophora mucronata TaxID=61149 RepID=A0A2P2PEZ3_RHIMU